MTTSSTDLDEIYTRLLITRTTRDAAAGRFALAGVLATDWSDAGAADAVDAADGSAGADDPGDLFADFDGAGLVDRTNCQVALATAGSLVQRSLRDFVA